MTPLPFSLAGAPWLAASATRQVLAVLEAGGGAARIVGGAVRNALIGEPVEDIDIATPLAPGAVMERARAAGLRAVPTGLDHGTVTLVAAHQPFEVTTLRRDVATDGRHAEIAFTEDWAEDARRRDFTMNALYVDARGAIFDPVGGYEDCLARRVRFIGDPAARIAEDYLRILRFFRFHARYGAGAPDAAGLAACIAARAGLGRLSAERIAAETVKLVTAGGAGAVVATMAGAGLWQPVLGGIAYPARFSRLLTLWPAGERPATRRLPAALGLAALAVRVREDAERLSARLRLSRALRQAMVDSVGAREAIGSGFAGLDAPAVRRLVCRFGGAAAEAGLALAAADAAGAAGADALAALRRAAAWQVPPFPVSGRDLAALGIPPGPAMGVQLAALKAVWIASDFTLGRAALLQRVPAVNQPPA